MKKVFFTVLTVFLLSVAAMAADDPTQTAPAGEIDENTVVTYPSNSFTYEETIGQTPGMDVYAWTEDDFCWIHHFDETGVVIMDVNLTIRAWDVDYAAGEVDAVYVDGVYIGDLWGKDDKWRNTVFNIDPAYLADGEMEVCVDIDVTEDMWAAEIDWSMLTVEYDYVMPAPEFGSLAAAAVILLSSPAFAYLVIKKRQ